MKNIFRSRFFIVSILALFTLTALDSCMTKCQRKSGKFVKKLNKLG